MYRADSDRDDHFRKDHQVFHGVRRGVFVLDHLSVQHNFRGSSWRSAPAASESNDCRNIL